VPAGYESSFLIQATRHETFEFLRIYSQLSFPCRLESSLFNSFLDPRLRGNDKKIRFSKLSKERYDYAVGYSGHEYGLEPSVIEVILGARIIERHITLDHNMWGGQIILQVWKSMPWTSCIEE
jgi:hypothetical protein